MTVPGGMSRQPGWSWDRATALHGLGPLHSTEAPGGSTGYVCKVEVTWAKPHVHQLCTPSAFWAQDTDDSPGIDGAHWGPSEEGHLSLWEGATLGLTSGEPQPLSELLFNKSDVRPKSEREYTWR